MVGSDATCIFAVALRVSKGPQFPWGIHPSVADGMIFSARSPLTRMSSTLPEFAFLGLVEMFERPFPGLEGSCSSLCDGRVLLHHPLSWS